MNKTTMVGSAHGKTGAAAAALVVVALFAAAAQAQDSAIIHLKDGRSSEADIISVDITEVSFRLPDIASIQKLPHTAIEHIEFPQPEAWKQTMELFEDGEYEKVVDTFKQVSTQLGASTGYPAPGNFATLAQRRLIDCYRRMRMPLEIGVVYRKLDWAKLPPEDRELQEIVKCWALVGDTKWEEARETIAETFKTIPDTHPVCSELNFLMGLIAEGTIPTKTPETEEEFKFVIKAREEAIAMYGRALGIDAGADPGMAAAGLRQAIENLIGMEEREGELKSMVHMYAGLHGNGKLWDGVDPYLAGLFAEKLEIAGGPVRTPKGTEGAGGPKEIKARYIRLERVSNEPSFFALAELEVISSKTNIAGIGRAKQSSIQKVGNKEFAPKLAVDGKTAPGFQAGTFARTEKEKDAWWELDLGAMKEIDELVLYNSKGQDGEWVKPPGTFRIRLLDGARKEVFVKEEVATPDPKSTIKISGGKAAAAADAGDGEA